MSYYARYNQLNFTTHALTRLKQRVTFEWNNEVDLKNKIIDMVNNSSEIIDSNNDQNIIYIKLDNAIKSNNFYLIVNTQDNVVMTATKMSETKMLNQYF